MSRKRRSITNRQKRESNVEFKYFRINWILESGSSPEQSHFVNLNIIPDIPDKFKASQRLDASEANEAMQILS